MISMQEAQNKVNEVATEWGGNPLLNACFNACLGYVAARCFTHIDPTAGALYGALSSIISDISNPIFAKYMPPTSAAALSLGSRAVGSALLVSQLHTPLCAQEVLKLELGKMAGQATLIAGIIGVPLGAGLIFILASKYFTNRN